jgi:hypothetical protein
MTMLSSRVQGVTALLSLYSCRKWELIKAIQEFGLYTDASVNLLRRRFPNGVQPVDVDYEI